MGLPIFIFILALLLKITFPLCMSPIYCQGNLLHVIQTSGIFKDCKTFVDLSLVHSVEKTIKNFDIIMAKSEGKPLQIEVLNFVQNHFQASHKELEPWFPPDFVKNPHFLHKLKHSKLRNFAKKLVHIWPQLGRKVKTEVLQKSWKFSILPIPHGFIIPGGRFREFYYWDSYWILKGLLICDMRLSAKGIIENFFKLVQTYGFIPNGGRIYYLDRSQPPLLTMMVEAYLEEAPYDIVWVKKNLKFLDQELRYWLSSKTVQVKKNGKFYQMARYQSSSDLPRPESYLEDLQTSSYFTNDWDKRQCYTNLRTGTETGWDFSTRWFTEYENISTMDPLRVIPVDLNAFLCKNFFILARFYSKFNEKIKAEFWLKTAKEFQNAIEEVLYHSKDGIWYDYDLKKKAHRRQFYPSNFAPLWTEICNKSLGIKAAQYLTNQGILEFEGGIPTSLTQSGQQWDLPNAWAPLQAIVIFGLEKSGDLEAQKIAELFARRWINSVMKVNDKTGEIFEKYNALYSGLYGGGGEYEVQTGFGWTNGVLLELIDYYFVKKKKMFENE